MNTIFSNFTALSIKQVKFNNINLNTNGFTFINTQSMDSNATNIIYSYFSSMPTNSKLTLLKNKKENSVSNDKYSQNSIHSTKILLSNPTFSHTMEKVTIHLFYYSSTIDSQQNYKGESKYFENSQNFLENFLHSSTNTFSQTLAQLYSKEVSLVITKIHYPYLNASIFAQYLTHNASTNTFVHFQDAILTYPSRYVPAKQLISHISGMKIQLSGRLATQRVIPRMTKKTALYGSFANGPFVDYGKFTAKNYIGAFTIKV